MNKSKKITIIILSAVFVLVVATVIWIIHGNSALELNSISIESERLPEGFDRFKIAHVSDLHNTEMGKGNSILLELLNKAEPDIIAITGDLIDSRRTDVDIALEFVTEAVKIAPCYYVNGNHESRVTEYADLKDGLCSIGVTVLSGESTFIEHGGDVITLMGIDDPAFSVGETDEIIRESISAIGADTSDYTLLLSHRPEAFEVYCELGVDLVLCGHAHGGQFRLPFIGGIAAPGQGLFPKYDSGVYTKDNTNMIVSRGIGNSLFPFRVNNPPEVILVELKSVTDQP